MKPSVLSSGLLCVTLFAGAAWAQSHDTSNTALPRASTSAVATPLVSSPNLTVDPATGIAFVNVFYQDPAQTSRAQFQMFTDAGGVKGVSIQAFGTSNVGTSFGFSNANFSIIQGLSSSSGLGIGTAGAAPFILGTANAERMRIDPAGNVGIGTNSPSATMKLHVVGNARFDGTVTGTNIQAAYQDVAEWVPVSQNLEAGTVVVLNPDRGNEVMPSTGSYDTMVAGVVSERPGLLLGVASDSKEMIATTGRVKVNVDASFGAIKVGDLLVTSDVPGVAMKSKPVDINGMKFHRPGTIIGKAIEPLASGKGQILVLLSMQ